MHKLLGGVSITIISLMFLVDGYAIYGPLALPNQIPTHFDSVGQPDAWSSSTIFILLPFAALILHMILTMVERYPGISSYTAEIPAQSRLRVESLAFGMIAWLKLETVGIFACIQVALIQAEYLPNRLIAPLHFCILLGIVIATIVVYAGAMVSAARPRQQPRLSLASRRVPVRAQSIFR